MRQPIVVYCDNHLLVLNKPENMPMQKDASEDPDVLSWAKRYIKDVYQKPGEAYVGLVHRLDRPVSGLVVLARTSKAAARLSEQVRQKTLRREYAAAVWGNPPDEGFLKNFLRKEEATNMVSVVSPDAPGAKEARLRYTVWERSGELSLLRVSLETGRSHQIRVQLSYAGYPLFGDQRYGKGPEKTQIALCSRSLTLCHPTTKELLTFTCPIPEYFPLRPKEEDQ